MLHPPKHLYIAPVMLQMGNLILKPVVELLEDQSPSMTSSYLWSNKQGNQGEIALLDPRLNKKARNFTPCLCRQKYPHLPAPHSWKRKVSPYIDLVSFVKKTHSLFLKFSWMKLAKSWKIIFRNLFLITQETEETSVTARTVWTQQYCLKHYGTHSS